MQKFIIKVDKFLSINQVKDFRKPDLREIVENQHKIIREQLVEQGCELITKGKPISVELDFVLDVKNPFVIVAVEELEKEDYHIGSPDLDNIIKPFIDSLGKVLIEEDHYIAQIKATKKEK